MILGLRCVTFNLERTRRFSTPTPTHTAAPIPMVLIHTRFLSDASRGAGLVLLGTTKGNLRK